MASNRIRRRPAVAERLTGPPDYGRPSLPGGACGPVFGAVAAARGTPAVFALLCLLPVPAVALSLLLPEPVSRD
jgi:hypothetical protein